MGVYSVAFAIKDAGGSSREYVLPFNNLTATAAPGVNDDSGDGYIPGSMWVDVTNDETYFCEDNSLGAAVWKQAGGGGSVAWGDITGTLADQTDLQSALDAKQPLDTDLTQIAGLTRAKGALIVGEASNWGLLSVGTDGQQLQADSLELTGLKWVTPSAAGDFVGPAVSTDNAVVRFDGTTGKLGQNSVVTIDDSGYTAGMIFTSAGAKIQSATSASYNTAIVVSGTQTANRTLTINVGDGSRNLTLEGNFRSTLDSVDIVSTSSSNFLVMHTTAVTEIYLPTSGTLATLAGTETLTNKTLSSPVITTFTSANHNHQDAIGGGTLSAAAIASGTLAVARGGTGVTALQSFSAYRNTNYSLPTAAWTKIPIDTERFDVGSIFDTTNNKGTPTIAGIYNAIGMFYSTDCRDNTLYAISIYKNGALFALGNIEQITATLLTIANKGFLASGLPSLNGSTDYVELFGYNGHATNTLTVVGGANNNHFDAFWAGPSS